MLFDSTDPNKEPVLNVNGCVKIEGKINVILNQQPNKNGEEEIQIVSQNCSEAAQTNAVVESTSRIQEHRM